ncbi:MAG: P-loop NTPase fold protein [Microcoleaceae cyanobacterium]
MLGKENMTSIDKVIKQEFNPFDPLTFRTGHFWKENSQSQFQTVDSIHQKEFDTVAKVFRLVSKDHKTRSILLYGDTGSGKSYFLKRVKSYFESQAFFAYISPWTESSYIWRHTLRYTVDSLTEKPTGQKEYQLLLRLKKLSIFEDSSLAKKMLGERRLFIQNFKSAYPAGIYQATKFFGVFFDLTNPELYPLACDWLRGEELEEDDMERLGVKFSIDSEDKARHILENFGRISTSTQPIVLCFDQIESCPRLPDGSPDLQPLMSLNTTFHNTGFRNFFVILSITRSSLKDSHNKNKIHQSDLDRFACGVRLKDINLEQAKELWEERLAPLHAQAVPCPESTIYPLEFRALEKSFPGGKANVRKVLYLGQKLFSDYKNKILDIEVDEPTKPDTDYIFKRIWQSEFRKVQESVNRIRYFSSLELASMLRKTLAALGIPDVKTNFLPSQTYKSYSLSFTHPTTSQALGVLWTEEPNSTTFYHMMRACHKVLHHAPEQSLYLIRAEKLSRPNTKGYKVYSEIFTHTLNHQHLKPNLESVHYLATYNRLLNSINAGEIFIEDEILDAEQFNKLVREAEVMKNCPLLQDLKIFAKVTPPPPPIKEFLLETVKGQQMIGRSLLVQNTVTNFQPIDQNFVDSSLEQLFQDNLLRLLNPTAKYEAQLICVIPKN